ncbi:hypothetical protein JCM19274_4584 [Algibacter lectus]|uniref:Uncharacterized protein n=1 Tax=Algibacter lectus TaxID=221126 RepID=A0A090WLY3_9FLAO|nr:hypothetical protein JCM19274_4584 [Algibacter lectus]
MNVYKALIIFTIAFTLNVGVGFAQTIPYEKPEWGGIY